MLLNYIVHLNVFRFKLFQFLPRFVQETKVKSLIIMDHKLHQLVFQFLYFLLLALLQYQNYASEVNR